MMKQKGQLVKACSKKMTDKDRLFWFPDHEIK